MKFASPALGSVVAVAAGVALVAACGPGAGVVARPADLTYANAASATACRIEEGRNEPFVVDWTATKRSDLEVALRESVAVVAYGCDSLKLLPDCHVEGSYAFVAVTPKDQFIHLENAEELHANLPLSGAAIALKLGAALNRGTGLDIGLTIAGKNTASRRSIGRVDLKGECGGATHFVRSTTVGAFSMRTASKGQFSTAADVFGGKFGSGSASELKIENRDGSLDACHSTKPDDSKLPKDCGAIVRLELKAIKQGDPGLPTEDEARANVLGEATRVACSYGLVADERGVCITKTPTALYICTGENLAECKTQCVKGSGASCAMEGRIYQTGMGAPKNLNAARTAFERGCNLDAPVACGRLGEILYQTGEKNQAKALLEKSCSAGFGFACQASAQIAIQENPDLRKVNLYALNQRGCDSGDAQSCENIGNLFDLGVGVAKEPERARRYFHQACEGGLRSACITELTSVYKLFDAPDDPKAIAAIRALDTYCESGELGACDTVASACMSGRGAPKDGPKAARLLERMCLGSKRSQCLTIAMLYRGGFTGVKADEAKAKLYFARACEGGMAPACEYAKGD